MCCTPTDRRRQISLPTCNPGCRVEGAKRAARVVAVARVVAAAVAVWVGWVVEAMGVEEGKSLCTCHRSLSRSVSHIGPH